MWKALSEGGNIPGYSDMWWRWTEKLHWSGSSFYKHKDSLQVKNPQNSTTLSTHFWNKTENGENPKVSWTIIESNIPTFNPVTKSCKLCLREKFNIVLNPHLATLNSRNEIFAHCRHMGSKLIDQKPDWTPLGPDISLYEPLFICLLFCWSLYACLMIGAPQ